MNINIKSIAIKSSICGFHLYHEVMTNHVFIFSYNQMKLMDS
jgi:hypothetical protein